MLTGLEPVFIGKTVTEEVVCPPGFHEYDVAVEAEAVNVVPVPEHKIVVDADIVGMGGEETVTKMLSTPLQPAEFVTATAYVVLIVGFTIIAELVCPPGIHE